MFPCRLCSVQGEFESGACRNEGGAHSTHAVTVLDEETGERVCERTCAAWVASCDHEASSQWPSTPSSQNAARSSELEHKAAELEADRKEFVAEFEKKLSDLQEVRVWFC